jgi:hypothetical protein
LDPERRRALSDFYREEFLRHLDYLRVNGVHNEQNQDAVQRAYRKFETDLDQVCSRADFPAVAETLLQSFDTLTRLSKLDPSKGH